MIRRFAIAAAVAVAFTAVPAQAQTKDIVDTAVGAGMFNTLVTAVKAAGLVDTLKGAGPFTVFAPTDEAFKKLPAGTVEGLLKDTAKLKDILLYHVVAGKVEAAQVVTLTEATDRHRPRRRRLPGLQRRARERHARGDGRVRHPRRAR